MKFQRLNPFIYIISLAIVGFFFGAYFPRLWDLFFNLTPFVFTVWESVISLVLLLVICLLCARIILWVYFKIRVPSHPRRILSIAFLTLAATPLIRIWVGFQQYQLVLKKFPDRYAGFPLSTGYINFFAAGLEIVLLPCAMIAVTLFWIARWRNRTEFTTSIITEKRRDVVLVISTLITLAFIVSHVIRFVTITTLFWTLYQG